MESAFIFQSTLPLWGCMLLRAQVTRPWKALLASVDCLDPSTKQASRSTVVVASSAKKTTVFSCEESVCGLAVEASSSEFSGLSWLKDHFPLCVAILSMTFSMRISS